jgi:hypothetical protein
MIGAGWFPDFNRTLGPRHRRKPDLFNNVGACVAALWPIFVAKEYTMRPLTSFIVIITAFFSTYSWAQTVPQEQWITTGTVKARIRSKGALVSEFRIPDATGDSSVLAIQDLLLWIGGVDPAKNLVLTLQNGNSSLNDFTGGFKGVLGSAGVWKVTKAQIKAHLADLADNGVIDNPIPAIFSWPAKGNPFSLQYNGFAVDTVSYTVPFTVYPTDNPYRPDLGDYPEMFNYYNNDKQPDEMVYVPFYEKSFHNPGFAFQGYALFYTFYCDETPFLDNAVFGYVKLHMGAQLRRDSAIASFVVNGDVGNPLDDYMGVQQDNNVVYFYNKNSHDAVLGDNPPIVAFKLNYGIQDTFGLPTLVNTVIRFDTASGIPQGMRQPVTPGEYYNYITGTWRDGFPLTVGGTGYNPGYPNTPHADIIYPGDPGNSSEWSEIGAANQPGDRRAVVSHKPVTMLPGWDYTMSFTLERIPGGASLVNQLQTLNDYSFTQGQFFFGDYFPQGSNPFDTISCFTTTATRIQPDAIPLQIFPNPATGYFQVDFQGETIHNPELHDLTGRRVSFTSQATAEGLLIRTDLLPAGVYWFSAVNAAGRRLEVRVVLLP